MPTLSTYFLISLTIIDIFLFIYFIHYITQSVKYETIIQHIHHETKESLKKYCTAHAPIPVPMQPSGATYELLAEDSGYFQNFEEDALLHLCDEQNWLLFFKQPSGTFILKGVPVLIIQNTTQISEEQHQKLMLLINFYPGQPFDDNPYNGFRQLTEIALKALSPGINDPGTAILSLHSMMDLLAFRLNNYPDPVIKNKAGIPRIIKKEPTFVAVFETYVLPIWDYGKEDRMLRKELYNLLMQLRTCTNEHVNLEPIISLMEKVAEKRAKVAEHF